MRLWDTQGIHPSLPKYTPALNINFIREPLGIYSSLPEYTPSPFLQCDSHRIYPSLLAAWISVHALEGAYIGPIYYPCGLIVLSVLGL